jgi:hypothetical protein
MRIRENRRFRRMSKAAHGRAQIEEGSTAAQQNLAPLRIDDRQHTFPIRTELHAALLDVKFPGLRVQDRRRQYRVVQKKAQLLVRTACLWKNISADLPGVLEEQGVECGHVALLITITAMTESNAAWHRYRARSRNSSVMAEWILNDRFLCGRAGLTGAVSLAGRRHCSRWASRIDSTIQMR